MMLGMSGTRITRVCFTPFPRLICNACAYHPTPDDFSGITISKGDVIKMTVTATSKTSGSAVIENETTGVTVTQTFSGETSGSLCEYDAEWIVEDYEECTSSGSCSLVPFANFGTVEFTSCSAVKSGTTVGVTGATILDIEQNSKVLTSCSDTSSTVTCTYE
jgi:hypothetical protein